MGDDKQRMTKNPADNGAKSYQKMKDRVEESFLFLRTELKLMREQDVALLKQLLQIQDTIATLSGKRARRQSCGSRSDVTETRKEHAFLNSSLPSRIELYRRLSAPPDTYNQGDDEANEDDNISINTLDEEAFDQQICDDYRSRDSFGSLDEIDLDLEKEMADYLSPLPSAFKRMNSRRDSSRRTNNNIKNITKCSANDQTISYKTDENPPVKYELSYSELLKRSSKLWKDVQNEQKETGKVDQKKMAALKLFL